MHTRRQARISALQALYELDTTNHTAADVIAHRVEDSQLPPEGEAFLRQLVSGVVVHRDRLDAADSAIRARLAGCPNRGD